jgi:drug/metabolite transporter (DMT)-like permease
MNKLNPRITAHLAIFIANIIFGINNPISRTLMPELIDPMALTFFRFAGGMILFWLASFFFPAEKVSKKDLLMLFFASILALTLNQIPFFYGLSITSPIDASIVVTLLPIVTMILAAIIMKEPITQLKAVGVLVGASGALIIVLNNPVNHTGESNMTGNLIVFLAVSSFALYLTLFKGLISRYKPITIMKWMFLFGTITGLPFCYPALSDFDITQLPATAWSAIFYVIIFATFFGYILVPVGQKSLRPTTLSMYNYLQPVMASIVSIYIGLDKFGIQQGLAGLLVFSGVYIVTQSKSRAQIEAEKAAGINNIKLPGGD